MEINRTAIVSGLIQAIMLSLIMGAVSLVWDGGLTRITGRTDKALDIERAERLAGQAKIEAKLDSLMRIAKTTQQLALETAENVKGDDITQAAQEQRTIRDEADLAKLDSEVGRLNAIVLRMAGRCCPGALTSTTTTATLAKTTN